MKNYDVTALGELLIDFDRQQYNNDHKETRRHLSLDGMDYEGGAVRFGRGYGAGAFAPGGCGPAHGGHEGPLPFPAGAGVKSLF